MLNNYFSFNKILVALSVLFSLTLNAQDCTPPLGVVNGGIGMHHARVYWTVPQNAPEGGYDWQLSLSNDTAILQSGTVQSGSLLVTGLLLETNYKLEVRSHCSETAFSTWAVQNFTTKPDTTITEGQIGFGQDANALFGASYGPIMYAGVASRNGSVADMLFTAEEMQSINIPVGAKITGVAFEKINAAYGGDNYPDLRLRLFAKNSSATAPLSMTTTYGDILTGHTEVADNPAYDLPATIGWIDFPFEDEFEYSGGALELATATYQNGQIAQFSSWIVWQFTAGYKNYLVGAWPINTVPVDENLLLSHNSGAGQYKDRPNVKIFYETSNAVTGINAMTQNNVAATISQNQGTLQLIATITPSSVSQEKIWQIISGAEFATISGSGLVTANANGTIIVQAVSADDASITDTIEITITGQLPPVVSVEILVADNAPATITTDNGTLQLTTSVLPLESNQNVMWSIASGGESATVDTNGLVTALNNGTVTIQAVSAEDDTVLDTIEITITGQIVAVASIEISVLDNAVATITTDNGTLQLIATVLPSNSNQNVVWSIISGNEFASVDDNGLVTALNNGTVTIQAVSAEDNIILDTIEITITNQVVAVASLEISVADNAQPIITTSLGTLQLIATVAPANSEQEVAWSITSGTENATVDANGLVTAIANGFVTVQAVSAEDNTILDTIEITITGQVLGLDEFDKATITIYPNPATATINIISESEVSRVEIYNLLGQKVLEGKGKSFNIAILSQSTYIIKIDLENGTSITKRIIKQ